MEARSQLQPGQMLGSYRIVRKIGQGGMGEVYEAWESALHRRIALKVLKRESLSDPEMTERFRGEGRALARLKQENVVSLYTVGEWQGRIYMAMEYIDGVPLDHFMMSHACSLGDVLSLARQMTEGLAAAHEAGVIHRDLKPANVVIDRTMRAKLVDFGIAKVHSERNSGPNTTRDVVIGTVNYLSPEATVGKPATEASDIYSLGLVFYHMLSGNTPFIGRSNFETLEKIRTTALAFSPRLQTLISDEIKRIVLKMTAKSPIQRYGSAREVLADLERIDINQLPVDLRQSTASGFPVANYTEVRKRCESLGFDASELRFILSIAAGLQADAGAPPSEEVTEKIDARPLLEISERFLMEAVRRFQKARSLMISRRQTGQQQILAARPPPPDDFGESLLTSLCVLMIFGAGFYLYRMGVVRFNRLNLRLNQQSVPAPPLTPPPAPTQERQVASEPVVEPAKAYDLARPKKEFTVSYTGADDAAEWKVTDQRGDQLIWESRRGAWEMRTPNPFLPALHAHYRNQEWVNTIEGDKPMAIFPLQKGKRATYRIQGQNQDENTKWSYNLTCFVGEESKLTVPAGVFQVLRVECLSDSGERTVYDFAPTLGHWVRLEKGQKTYELSGYSLGQQH